MGDVGSCLGMKDGRGVGSDKLGMLDGATLGTAMGTAEGIEVGVEVGEEY